MKACSCNCVDPRGRATHAISDALANGDIDRALSLGLLDAEPCPGCHAACSALLVAARDERRTALAARERFRARNRRLERRAAERAARRQSPTAAPGSAPPLPPAAADALARALAKAGLKR